MSVTIDPARPLPAKLRALFGLTRLLQTVRVMPTASKLAALPKAKRAASGPAGFMVPKPTGSVSVTSDAAGSVPLRVYRPAGSLSGTAILFIHGGGFTVGGLESLDWWCRQLAVDTASLIASVEYRLAPDDRFPAALDDCTDALTWLAGKASDEGLTRLVVMGDSAGGNLAATTVLRNSLDGGPKVDRQILIYPATDCTVTSPTMEEKGPGLSRADLRVAAVNYLGDHDPRDPLASPVFAAESDLAALPPAFILTAEHDVLRDDGNRYLERLLNAGVPAKLRQYAGAPHGFFSLYALVPSAAEAHADVVAYLTEAAA